MDPVTGALVAWLVDQAATTGQGMLSRWLGADKQAKALRGVVSEAVAAAIAELDGPTERGLVEEVLGHDSRDTSQINLGDVFALRDAVAQLIAPRLAALAEQGYPIDVDRLADAIARHIERGIQLDAARGGPLAPVADLLRHERLAGTAERIADLLGGTRASSPTPPGRVVRLAPRTAPLAGREGLLETVRERLAAAEGRWPREVALHGLGGAGKTSVAVEYAHVHLDEYGVVWQLAAEDQATLAAGFAELGRQLTGSISGGDPVAQVHGILADRQDGWLLIFDNADAPAAVRGVLPPAGRGHVIVTSRNPQWPGGQGIEVPVLELAAAAGFLAARTGAASSPGVSPGAVAWELAAELGGLPLALEQAAAYMEATGLNLGEYLRQFRTRRAALLSRGAPFADGKTVASTWSLAFGQLERSAPTAVDLLRLLACCAPEAVPLSMLLRPSPGLTGRLADGIAPLLDDQLTVHDAIGALRRFSLVIPAGDQLVLVHRLVQAVTLDQMPADVADAWQRTAAALTETAVPVDVREPDAWPACAALLPHARAVLPAVSEALGRIADYLGVTGSYILARDLWQEIATGRGATYGPEHPATVIARRRFAHWAGEAGDLATARGLFAELLPVFEQVLGPDHPDTLATRHGLAEWTGKDGDAALARDQFAELLPVRERVLGAEHFDTLATRGNLAYWTGDAGDPAAARDQFAELVSVLAPVLGPEHPDTLASRHSLAYWTREAGGDPTVARDQFAELLPVRERVLGAEHPDTLETRHDLADSTGMAGDPAAARDQFAELLPVRERVLGPEHFDTQAARESLAFWSAQAAEPGESYQCP